MYACVTGLTAEHLALDCTPDGHGTVMALLRPFCN